MTTFEQNIYNIYLRTLRTHQNKPFKYRKDFKELEGTETEAQLIKLSRLFGQHKHIKIDLFFESPYQVYEDSTSYYLDYYTTQKAIKAYSLNVKKLKYEDPDSEQQLKFIIESFNFIKRFCAEVGVSVDDYCNVSTGVTFNFLEHLKHFQVSPYALFNYSDFEKNLLRTDKDVLYFVLSEEYVENFYVFRNKYLQSKKCKTLSELAFIKTKNKQINENIQH